MKRYLYFLIALVGWSVTLHAQSSGEKQFVRLTTEKAVGEEMEIRVTSLDEVTVDWGDGTIETYTPGLIKGMAKGATIVVAGNRHMTGLDCSAQMLTAINTDGAPHLLTLQCANNRLAQLSLSHNTALQQLDCSDNQLTKLTLAGEELTSLDCSRNALTALSVSKLTALQHLFCADNDISSLALVKTPALQTLWCQGNKLKILSLAGCPNIQSIHASRNQLAAISIPNAEKIQDIWCDDNALINLTIADAKPRTVNCARNQMSTLVMTPPSATYNPYLIDQSDNKFLMKDFYTSRYITHYFIDGQADVQLPFTQVPVGEYVDFGDYLTNNAGVKGSISFYDAATGAALTKGAKGLADYYVKASEVKFWNDMPDIYFKITHPQYPGLELTSTPFYVGTGTGIASPSALSNREGAEDAFDLQGRKVSKPTKGVYIINGQKVIIK